MMKIKTPSQKICQNVVFLSSFFSFISCSLSRAVTPERANVMITAATTVRHRPSRACHGAPEHHAREKQRPTAPLAAPVVRDQAYRDADDDPDEAAYGRKGEEDPVHVTEIVILHFLSPLFSLA
jgi:hypothetical protein